MAKDSLPHRDVDGSILEAAFHAFAQCGYSNANIDDVARDAQVAKPTIYNRFRDKRSLFVAALRFGTDKANKRVMDAINALSPRTTDLKAALEEFGIALSHCVTTDEGAGTLRLLIAERGRFPELEDMDARAQHVEAFAGKLGQLVALGRLRSCDPQIAAQQFMALATTEALVQSEYGRRKLRPSAARDLVAAGVQTFLAAYGQRQHGGDCP